MADIEYVATLNNQQVLDALKSIDANIDKMASQADSNFEKVGKSAGSSGLQIGAVAGIVSSVTTEFIHLGEEAVRVLEDITKQGIQTALGFDKLKAQLTAIFAGSKPAVDEAFNFIQDRSKKLGINLEELSSVFLPKVQNLEQFERIAKLATAIARTSPGGEQAATISLTEALTGQFTSLQRRANIAKTDIDEIKKAFQSAGVEGFISKLEEVLQRTGRSFDATSKTAEVSFSKIGESARQLEGKIGEPIVKELKNLADNILSFVNENQDDLAVFADTIGRTIADALKFIGSIDFSKIDTKTLIEIADYAYRIVKALEIASTQVGTFLKEFSDLPGVSQIIQGLEYEVTHLDDALLTLSQIFALLDASLAAFEANADKGANALLALKAAAEVAQGDLVGAYDDINKIGESLQTSQSSQDAFNSSIQASQKQFDDYRKSVQDNTKAQDDLRQTLDETKNSSNDAADAVLEAADAERKAAADAEKLKEAQDKVNKAEEDAAKDYGRKLEDIDKNFERKRLDIAIEFAQKREDAARNNVQKLDDIQTKHSQDVSDAALDLTRKEEDIARKHGQEIQDLERTQRQKRLDIETTYRRKLQDIQRTFLLDADEAEKKRDAVAFLQALKKRNEDVKNAQIDRNRSIADTKVEGDRKREELAIQQKREIKEAQIANERKLEDLKTNLERQIKAQNLAYERQLQDISIGEERKNEEAQKARERDIEDAKTAYDRKLSDLKESLSAEYDIIKAANAKTEEEQARHNSVMAANSTGAPSQPPGQDFTPYDTQIKKKQSTYQAKSIYGYASGGLVPVGQQAVVGERGPELANITRSGAYITPNAALRMNSLVPGGARGGNVNNNFSQQVTLPDVAGLINNPVAVRQVENIVARALGKIF